MKEIGKKKYQALALALAGTALLGTGTVSAADAQTAVEQAASQDSARQSELDRAQAVRIDRITVPVAAVEVQESTSLTREVVLSLVPELEKNRVNVHTMSRQIQLVNDTGAARLQADLRANPDGTFTVVVANEAQKNERYGVSVSNSGNEARKNDWSGIDGSLGKEYMGDWRATLSYMNNNISKHSDSLGLAYVTSPDKHFSDMQQFAASYRTLLPRLGGALLVNASYYNIDKRDTELVPGMGDIYFKATDKGMNAGVHYQHYLACTSREKDILDIGLNYKHSRSDTHIALAYPGGIATMDFGGDYSVLLGSVGFIHNDRSSHHAFSYDVAFVANANGDVDDYEAYWGTKEKFTFLKAGVSYQVKSPSDWSLATRVVGQYTRDHLVTLAQLGAGGVNSVRGFSTNAVTGDKGVVGSVELYTPEIARGSRFLAFFDYGTLANNKNSASTCFGNESIASTGLGYRYADRENGWYASLDWAKIIDDIDSSYLYALQRRPWQLTVTKYF